MRNSPFWWILIISMVLLDIYVFQAVKVIANPAGARSKIIIYSAYWIISAAAIIVLLILPYLHFAHQEKVMRTTIFAIVLGLFFAKLISGVFFLIDDIRRGGQWAAGKIFFSNTEGENLQAGEKISRSVFLTWAGMVAGGGLFATLMNGFGNKYQYQVKKTALSFSNLPKAFKGLKIVHISDIHSGSLMNKSAVLKGVEKILSQQPDLIVFTGDLVNNKASEMELYSDVFNKLKAPLGVYSTLGNHDYGDYVQWPSNEEKNANLQRLKEVHAEMGWRLLMNEHIVLEKDGDKIALMGIENWSAKARFPKYGNMNQAYTGYRSLSL